MGEYAEKCYALETFLVEWKLGLRLERGVEVRALKPS